MYHFEKFRKQNILVQLEQICCHGIKLDLSRNFKGFRIILYSIADYYVEVWYDRKSGEILQVQSFTTVTRLDPYLKKIDIREITGLLKLQ